MSQFVDEATLRFRVVNNAKAELQGIVNDFKGLDSNNKTLGASFMSLGTRLTGLIGVVAGVAASFRGLGQVIAASIDEAAQDELGINRLGAAIRTTGGQTRFLIPHMEKLTDEFERQYGVVDDKLRAGFTQLTYAMVPVSRQADIMRTAIQLSRAAQVDLGSALDALVKSSAGVNVGLTRLVATLGIAIPESATFEQKLKLINERTSQAAQADMEAYAGQTERLNKAFRDASGTLGSTFLPVWGAFKGGLATAIQSLNDFFVAWDKIYDKELEVHSIQDAINKQWPEMAGGVQRTAEEITTLNAVLDEQAAIYNYKLKDYINQYVDAHNRQAASVKGLNVVLREQAEIYNYLLKDSQKQFMEQYNDPKNLLMQKGAALVSKMNSEDAAKLKRDAQNALNVPLETASEGSANVFERYVDENETATDTMTQNWAEYGVNLANTFAQSAQDFENFFAKPTISSALQLATTIVKILALFDKRENDMVAYRSGQDYMNFTFKGAIDTAKRRMSELVGSVPFFNPMTPAIAGMNGRFGSFDRRPTVVHHHHYNGTFVTPNDWIDRKVTPRIEESVNIKRSRLKKDTSMLSGGRDSEHSRSFS